MLKKPLFWIIVVIVIVILWFVFAGHSTQNMGTGQTGATSTQTTTAPGTTPGK